MSTDAITRETWAVYTMTHDDEMYDDSGEPVDDYDFNEWCIGADVDFAGDLYQARSASPVAEGMTYGVAMHIASWHNLLVGAAAGDALAADAISDGLADLAPA